MKRDIIHINESLCDGCGLCTSKCAEGALRIIDGKARLISETYCDGLGACIGECPRGAITIEHREAASFDEAAVHAHLSGHHAVDSPKPQPLPCGCPGSAMRSFTAVPSCPDTSSAEASVSQLSHWPVQMALVPSHAPFLRNADILVSADCAPFAIPDFHSRFLGGRAVLVGCPKLDDISYYREKLNDVFSTANPKSITVLRMEVPCCGGLARAVTDARNAIIPGTPLEIVTVGIHGDIIRETVPSPV